MSSGRPAPARPSATARPAAPGRRALLGASVMCLVGAWLPWMMTGLGGLRGGGAALWVFYASMLGLAGALVPWPRVAGVQALLMAAAALGLGGWQAVHLLRLVGLEGWMPGPGLVLTLGGGVLAAVAGRALLTSGAR